KLLMVIVVVDVANVTSGSTDMPAVAVKMQTGDHREVFVLAGDDAKVPVPFLNGLVLRRRHAVICFTILVQCTGEALYQELPHHVQVSRLGLIDPVPLVRLEQSLLETSTLVASSWCQMKMQILGSSKSLNGLGSDLCIVLHFFPCLRVILLLVARLISKEVCIDMTHTPLDYIGELNLTSL